MITTPGGAGCAPKARPIRSGESGELGDIRRHARHADAAHQHALLEQRHSARIHGVRIAVVQIRFAGENAQARVCMPSMDRAGGKSWPGM